MLKRTPLKPRKKPLKRGKAPKRSPLVRKVVNRIKAKGKPRFKQGRDPQYLEWIRGMPCAVSCVSCVGGPKSEAAHVKSRGAGGADLGNTIPLCEWHHGQQHRWGIKSWASFWFGSLAELRRIAAEVYPRQYLAQKNLGFPE